MASSGSMDFTVNRNEIINLSAEMAGIKGQGFALSAGDISSLSTLLNLIVKQSQGKADFAKGIKSWSRKRAYLFPQTNTTSYSLGPSGTHFTASYTSTTLSAAEASGQTTISVTSTTGMTVGDYVGIIQDNNTIHWSTISSIGAGTIVIAAATTGAAASGKTVYFYTTKAPMPLSIISMRRRNTSNTETPLLPMLVEEYEDNVLNKATDAFPSRYLYERGITNGTVMLDYEPTDTTEIYLVTYLRPIEDFDAATDTPDYPQEWYRYLVGQLGCDAAVWRGIPVSAELRQYRDEALAVAGNVDPEDQVMFFQPEL